MTVIARLTDVLGGPNQPDVWIHLLQPWPGYWLAAYDPDAFEGFGQARFTPDVGEAMRFDTIDDVKALWEQQSSVLPERDGRPYRPLTCVSLETVELENVGTH